MSPIDESDLANEVKSLLCDAALAGLTYNSLDWDSNEQNNCCGLS